MATAATTRMPAPPTKKAQRGKPVFFAMGRMARPPTALRLAGGAKRGTSPMPSALDSAKPSLATRADGNGMATGEVPEDVRGLLANSRLKPRSRFSGAGPAAPPVARVGVPLGGASGWSRPGAPSEGSGTSGAKMGLCGAGGAALVSRAGAGAEALTACNEDRVASVPAAVTGVLADGAGAGFFSRGLLSIRGWLLGSGGGALVAGGGIRGGGGAGGIPRLRWLAPCWPAPCGSASGSPRVSDSAAAGGSGIGGSERSRDRPRGGVLAGACSFALVGGTGLRKGGGMGGGPMGRGTASRSMGRSPGRWTALRSTSRSPGRGTALRSTGRSPGRGTALRSTGRSPGRGTALRSTGRSPGRGTALRSTGRSPGRGTALRSTGRSPGRGTALRSTGRSLGLGTALRRREDRSAWEPRCGRRADRSAGEPIRARPASRPRRLSPAALL